MLVEGDFFAKIVALVATKNVALSPATQIIYVCGHTFCWFRQQDRSTPLQPQLHWCTDFTPNVAKQLEDLNHWKAFQCKGLHFLHINVNSILPKIDEVNLIANKSNATILGISETKLDNTIMDSELKIEGYDLIRSDRNRRGGGVAC